MPLPSIGIKVIAFYNIGWFLAASECWRARDPFVRDLAVTLALYLLLAYIVVYERELRHYLPFAIVVIPLTLRRLETDFWRARAPGGDM